MSRFRHEYKYYLNSNQNAILKAKVNGLLKKDPHADKNNKYVIRSLYLDNLGDECFKENASGNDNRTKYRIRYYNNDLKRITFEKKSKIRGMCLKESCLITKDECEQIINGNIPDIKENDPEIKKRLFTEAKLKGMLPKVIVTYVRTPYIYRGGNVRVTFDEDITSSNDIKNFLNKKYVQRPILEKGKSILEVKWDEVLPLFIKEVMCLENYTWTAFSKYFMCRIMHL